MDISYYRKDFLEQVKARAAASKDMTPSAFVTVAANYLVNADEIQDFEPCYHEGLGVNDKRLRSQVNGYAFDDVDGSVKLLVADFKGSEEKETLTQAVAEKVFGRLHTFLADSLLGDLHPTLDKSKPQYALSSELANRRAAITRFHLFLVTDAELSRRIKSWPESDFGGVPVEYHLWDISRFHRAYESSSGRDELEIDLTEFSKDGIPCLEASQDSTEYKSYLSIIPGTILADLYDKYGSRLLEGNVRAFLGIRGQKSVNIGIRKTINHEPDKFFVFNNGISATASEVDLHNNGSGLFLKTIKDLQIVNGGQTTASLSNTRRKDKAKLDNIFVQMKLSVVAPDIAADLIPEISRYANTQNKINSSDFFSNHQFHVRMETHSRKVWARPPAGAQHETHWFYERARGQYVSEQSKLSSAEKKTFEQQNPRKQLITKTDLAKYEMAWSLEPHTVSLGAQKNFMKFAENIEKEWDKSDKKFNEEYFRRVVAKAVIWKATERLVSDQDWYEGGYRANIVAYSISMLASMIQKQFTDRTLDLAAVWKKQEMPQASYDQLVIIASEVAKVLTASDRPIENVTEYSKRKFCWEKVEGMDISLNNALVNELVSLEEVIADEKDAEEDQVLNNYIEAQTTVFNLGAPYWNSIYEWNEKEKMLSPQELGILEVGCNIPQKVPTDKQSNRLLAIKDRAESNGFYSEVST